MGSQLVKGGFTKIVVVKKAEEKKINKELHVAYCVRGEFKGEVESAL